MSLGMLILLVSLVLFLTITPFAYYFMREVILNWEYGHSKDKWPKTALAKSVRVNRMLKGISTFLMLLLPTAALAIYSVERGSVGGSYLAATIIVPSIGFYILRRVFSAEAERCKWLMTQ